MRKTLWFMKRLPMKLRLNPMGRLKTGEEECREFESLVKSVNASGSEDDLRSNLSPIESIQLCK